jgi:altronate hydrolase
MSKVKTIRLHASDNVVVAVRSIKAGMQIEDSNVTVIEDIPRGHKVAIAAINKGEEIRKYGQFIGHASEPIEVGAHVHCHNCIFAAPKHGYSYGTNVQPVMPASGSELRTFRGYRRGDGRSGTRNYVAVISTVNCSASVSRYIADAFNQTGRLEGYPNIDGVFSFTHGTGCGIAWSGEGYDNLERVILGIAAHPNIGGVLLVGLGCEVFQISKMVEKYALKNPERFFHMTIQEAGGTRKTIGKGVEKITEMLPIVNDVRREPIPAAELVVALQCGGSDAYSGITANPALGVASDLLVAQGGTTILSETPEIYGAEHLLTQRAVSRSVGEKLVERIRWWEEYTKINGASMDNNPTPGNKAGGLTTILEKALGAVAKGGTAPLAGVYHYGERIGIRGFVFMDSPGYDPVSITGQVAAGANVVCFTTGRGSAYGCKPSPCLKLATNTPLFETMAEDMDINCGDIIDGEISVIEKGQEIFDAILRVASGEKTKSELLGIGDMEFVPWQIGATI